MTTVPMERGHTVRKEGGRAMLSHSQGSHAGNHSLWSRLSLWDAQATAANSQETLQTERAGERAPRLPEP